MTVFKTKRKSIEEPHDTETIRGIKEAEKKLENIRKALDERLNGKHL